MGDRIFHVERTAEKNNGPSHDVNRPLVIKFYTAAKSEPVLVFLCKVVAELEWKIETKHNGVKIGRCWLINDYILPQLFLYQTVDLKRNRILSTLP